MILYRPTGLKELTLVYESGLRAWPPRLPEQPIFYPVLNFGYAAQIARDWNTKSNDFAGYVTEFEVEDTYIAQFERQIVGGREHEELWIPAEQLEEFNRHIIGLIKVTGAYFGSQFKGYVTRKGMEKERDAIAQFVLLAQISKNNPPELVNEIETNHLAIFLHFPFWMQYDFVEEKISLPERNKILKAVQSSWLNSFPTIPLPKLSK